MPPQSADGEDFTGLPDTHELFLFDLIRRETDKVVIDMIYNQR